METIWTSTLETKNEHGKCIGTITGNALITVLKGNDGETGFLTGVITEILNQNSKNIDDLLQIYRQIGKITMSEGDKTESAED